MNQRDLERGLNRAALLLARLLTPGLVCLTGTLLLLSVLGPLLAEVSPEASRAIHAIFKLSCHQIPDRCLTIGPGIAPLCARCQAIYLGLFGAGIVGLSSRVRRPLPFWAMAVAALPMAIDGVGQIFGTHQSPVPLRMGTGLLFGVGVGAFVFPLLRLSLREVERDLLPLTEGAGVRPE